MISVGVRAPLKMGTFASRHAAITSGRKAGVTMKRAPAAMPSRAVAALRTVPRPKTKSGSAAVACRSMAMAPGVVMVSSMLVSPPAARARAQSSSPSEESARMRAMTFSALILARTASFFMGEGGKMAVGAGEGNHVFVPGRFESGTQELRPMPRPHPRFLEFQIQPCARPRSGVPEFQISMLRRFASRSIFLPHGRRACVVPVPLKPGWWNW